MIGNYRGEHAPDQLVLTVSVYRVLDRSVAQPVSGKSTLSRPYQPYGFSSLIFSASISFS